MLRVPLQRGGSLVAGAVRRPTRAQWLAAQRAAGAITQRYFADQKRADEILVPGSNSRNAPVGVPQPPILNPANPTATSSTENIPKTPPPPPPQAPVSSKTTGAAPAPLPPTGTGTASIADSPPPPPPKKSSRTRRFFTALVALVIVGYVGGSFYSLYSDNFHDFFTEYVPFAEDIVGYLEEREFRRRFPGGTSDTRLYHQIRGEQKVLIPGQGGVTARVAEESTRRSSDLGSTGSHMSAVESPGTDTAKQTPNQTTGKEQTKAVEQAKKDAPSPKAVPAKDTKAGKPAQAREVNPEPTATPAAAPATSAKPVAPIDHVNIPGGEEQVVQDVVKILNDIIAVVNADNASGKYSSTIDKAKTDLSKVVQNIETLKATQQKAADDAIRNLHVEFDAAAKDLLHKVDNERKDEEARWKDEYESERQKLSQAYDNKLKSEIDATKKFFDEKLQNELLEQALALRKDFNSTVRNQVETERSGRLGKLDQLSTGVQELEKLTSEWNTVVDSNLKTQHLLVAVEAVRATLEKADRPKPFLTELAALKEVANDDAVVNAAIASINPTAYQRGVPSPAQLIDRFRRVSTEIRKAALLPENAGIASHIVSLAMSKFMFKKSGLPVGDDVESVLTRTEAWLEEGDLDAAAREMNGLNGWAKVISRDWLGECRKVLEVQQALDVIATEARLQSLLVD